MLIVGWNGTFQTTLLLYPCRDLLFCLDTDRTGRSGSVVVYPESEDAGKPKVFARQSFVVCGEEEEMAETILQARTLGE